MVMKPKSNLKVPSKHQRSWSSDLTSFLNGDPVYGYSNTLQKRLNVKIVSLITGFLLLFYIFSSLFSGGPPASTSITIKKSNYPAARGVYINEIQASSPLIYPHVDHAKVLKEIGIRGLYILRLQSNGDNRYVIKPDDKPLSDEEVKKTTDQVLLVKRSFLDHGKLVYRKENGPEVVVVTLIDFEKYDRATLVKIIQNRVDYAERHKYGVYIRWIQEFLPMLEAQNLQSGYDYIKPLVVRAAMHAFPSAKHVVFVDQRALFMDMNISIQKHVLDPKVVDMAIRRDIPVVANSNIKTYHNVKVENVKLLIPQGKDGNLDMSCFVTSTDSFGKRFFEFLGEPLIRNYNWNTFEQSVGHIFQWHSSFLARTAIVYPKLFSSVYNPEIKNKMDNVFEYTEGDLIISFKGCDQRGSCVKDINEYYELVKK
ncbi:hypothetical protein Kpol_2002p62 [Vanderwaltozyma polyspora DSM 70294]|uniref:Alpha-1,6-mannosyltransferase MNN11 n=1 Tax=Vanderwaltozyma polyspora (strain ATCC 22028 / DSM 70294 / BCRC 21397 / CBS 2163 / NBRC 10782 / NRRL Y-8283 / UCD 57-17) TaxID=436907 RepID=A7TFH7_VANPO|nr:uncharacterized protein Kpol_2002p62 [Vanderwaltozyma polyspora DSM 70294]EDO18991.1 hypothetical protein Kpol_2002p62 [Vanderwaltozyma polyspora DSM 70294]